MVKNETRISFYKTEIIFFVSILFIIVAGITAEIIVKSGKTIFAIDNLRGVALTLLQIQSGVTTLSVALLALISGMINDEIYGISTTDYYLLIRPKILKQHFIIIAVIISILIGIVCIIPEFYNIIFAVFFCDCLLVIFSVIEIMPVFLVRESRRIEIKKYLLKEIKSFNNHDVIIQFLNYCESKPDENIFDEEILWASLESLLKENTNESIDILNNEWCKMIGVQLKHNESWVVKRGIYYLQATYHKIWEFILKNQELCGFTQAPILFSNLYKECRLSLRHISMDEMEECFEFHSFFEYVSRVDSWYFKNNQEKFVKQCYYIEKFSRYTGYLLSKKLHSAIIPLNEYDIDYWGKMLRKQDITDCNVPDESVENFKLHRCKVYLGYTISLVLCNQKELLKKSYIENNQYNMTSSPYVTVYHLAVTCYLYYLAEVESTYYVSDEIRECADYLLSLEEYKHQFASLLERTNWQRNINFFNKCFKTILKGLLRNYEQYNENQVKTLVIDSVVELFSLFIQCYLDNYRIGLNFSDMTDYETLESQILGFLDGDKREKTKMAFRKLYSKLINKDKHNDENADHIFYKWEKRALNNYKKEKVNNAIKAQRHFIEDDVEKTLHNSTKESLKKHFIEQFGQIIDQSIVDGDDISINTFYRCKTEDLLSEKSIVNYYYDLDVILFNEIAYYLYSHGKVSIYDRTDKSDSEFLSDLRNEDINLLIGADYELDNKDFHNWKMFRQFWEECESIFISGTDKALAIHKDDFSFAVQDIDVTVDDSTLDQDDSIIYDKEYGKYRIKLINNIAGEFSKDDAETYIKNQGKIVYINIRINLKEYKEKFGYQVENTFPS